MDSSSLIELLYNPLWATSVASTALVVSLYALYRQFEHGTSKRKKGRARTNKKIRLTVLHKSFLKDALTIVAILFIVGGIFAGTAYAEEIKFWNYVRLGANSLFNISAPDAREKASVAASSELAGVSTSTLTSTSTSTINNIAENNEVAASVEEKSIPKEKTKTKEPESVPKPIARIVESLPKPPPPPPAIETNEVNTLPVEEVKEVKEAEGPAPDIVSSAFSYYGSPLVEGGLLSFSVIVANKGSQNASVPFNTRFSIDEGSDGSFDAKFALLTTRPLEIGESETKIWKSAWAGKPGTHRAEACADIGGAILETDEKNNCVSLTLSIAGKTISGDLSLSGVYMSSAAPTAGGNVSFYANVNNIGAEKSSHSFVQLTIDGRSYGKKYISALSPGAFDDIAWTTIWQATAGPHRYEICADADDEVLESNEENNCAVGTFEVSP